MHDLGEVSEKELLHITGLSETEYHETSENMEMKALGSCKSRMCEMNIMSYDRFIAVVEIKYYYIICDYCLCHANFFNIILM